MTIPPPDVLLPFPFILAVRGAGSPMPPATSTQGMLCTRIFAGVASNCKRLHSNAHEESTRRLFRDFTFDTRGEKVESRDYVQTRTSHAGVPPMSPNSSASHQSLFLPPESLRKSSWEIWIREAKYRLGLRTRSSMGVTAIIT